VSEAVEEKPVETPSAVDVEGDHVALPEGKRFDGKLGCAITLVAGIACVGAAWAIMRVRSAAQLDAGAELAELVRQAESADGAESLRDAGCDHAAVIPMDALRNIAQHLENNRAANEKREATPIDFGTSRIAVVCGTAKPGAIDCAKVSTTFAGAIKNVVLPFIAIVETEKGPLCTAEYSGDPDALSDKKTFAIPPLFYTPE
jgi:hypothetical protein